MKLIIIVINFLLFNFVLLIFFYPIFFYLIFLVDSWMRNNLSSQKMVIKKALTLQKKISLPFLLATQNLDLI